MGFQQFFWRAVRILSYLICLHILTPYLYPLVRSQDTDPLSKVRTTHQICAPSCRCDDICYLMIGNPSDHLLGRPSPCRISLPLHYSIKNAGFVAELLSGSQCSPPQTLPPYFPFLSRPLFRHYQPSSNISCHHHASRDGEITLHCNKWPSGLVGLMKDPYIILLCLVHAVYVSIHSPPRYGEHLVVFFLSLFKPPIWGVLYNDTFHL